MSTVEAPSPAPTTSATWRGCCRVARDWNYPRQLLTIRAAERGMDPGSLFTRDFLEPRPLLRALEHDGPVVLLIDEVDRADDEFEAFLLELLSDFQVVPELGTITARGRPLVVLTSNRTRELHYALKRRCLYHWMDYPDPIREAEIVRSRLPQVPEQIARRVCTAVARLRRAGALQSARAWGRRSAGRGRCWSWERCPSRWMTRSEWR